MHLATIKAARPPHSFTRMATCADNACMQPCMCGQPCTWPHQVPVPTSLRRTASGSSELDTTWRQKICCTGWHRSHVRFCRAAGKGGLSSGGGALGLYMAWRACMAGPANMHSDVDATFRISTAGSCCRAVSRYVQPMITNYSWQDWHGLPMLQGHALSHVCHVWFTARLTSQSQCSSLRSTLRVVVQPVTVHCMSPQSSTWCTRRLHLITFSLPLRCSTAHSSSTISLTNGLSGSCSGTTGA